METTKGSEMQALQVNHETLRKQVTVVFLFKEVCGLRTIDSGLYMEKCLAVVMLASSVRSISFSWQPAKAKLVPATKDSIDVTPFPVLFVAAIYTCRLMHAHHANRAVLVAKQEHEATLFHN